MSKPFSYALTRCSLLITAYTSQARYRLSVSADEGTGSDQAVLGWQQSGCLLTLSGAVGDDDDRTHAPSVFCDSVASRLIDLRCLEGGLRYRGRPSPPEAMMHFPLCGKFFLFQKISDFHPPKFLVTFF